MSDNADDNRVELSDLPKADTPVSVLRYAIQALGGGIPLVGGIATAGAGAWAEHDQNVANSIYNAWISQLNTDLKAMGDTLADVLKRIDWSDDAITERLKSPEYQGLVSKVMRSWGTAATLDKRNMLRRLLGNAAATTVASDDVVALFIDWIDNFTDTHFKVVSIIYKNPQITRYEIWSELGGNPDTDRDDSPDADLFKYIINQLSQSQVIMQFKPKTERGEYLRQKPSPKGSLGSTLQSPWEATKPYVLTPLGTQFVHYALNELVPKIGDGQDVHA